MKLTRMFRHLLAPHWLARRAFTAVTMRAIEAAVATAEQRHVGELRFVVEAGLPINDLWHDISARERAVDVFSRLRVWDTQHNNGVLIYVQLIDRRVEIVADRGINAKVDQSSWDVICRAMEHAFRAGAYSRGSLEAVESVGKLLAMNFPALPGSDGLSASAHVNELPDRPVLL
ncbi:MAG: TPM domain-containing protein [Proteobacteria bacterium]|nr:TPM domain-containing protein [Pseudomonadota bacterium]